MENPVALFFCGTNGSGKSTLREKYPASNFVSIDSDRIAKIYGDEFLGGKEAIRIFQKCLKERISFSMETTLSGKSAMRRLKMARDCGFEVEIVYIGLDNVELHCQRVAQRVAKGGHNIPTSKILKRYNESLAHLLSAIKIAKRVEIFDNTHFYKSVMTIKNQEIVFFDKNAPQWARKIYAAIKGEQ